MRVPSSFALEELKTGLVRASNRAVTSLQKKSNSMGDNSHQTGWTAIVSKGGLRLRDFSLIGLDLALTG